MRQNILRLIFVAALLTGGVYEATSQERPKLREISDKKYENALNGVVPCEKKEECGYADSQGKFIIPAIFHKVMPMSDKHVGFVCFLDDAGKEYWTPISLKGLYLTDLNFSKVVKDFDDRGLAVVRQEDKYGIINHTGKMVAGCNYQHFEDKTPVYILYTNGGGCIAVAKDKSEKGYTSYSFAAQEPIIVKAEEGYGIISPKNYFVVADFIYDSVKELVTWEAYCLQKGQKKYLYAADKLSMGYEEVISIQGGAYFVVKYNGKYGILTAGNEILLSCCQDEIPVLKKNEYTCLYENGSPVYLTIGKRISTSEYDDYLYNVKYKGAAVEYLLEETLAFENKKYVVPSLAACYGTKNFDLLSHLEVAKEYAENRKFILLSRDNENARFYDLESKSYIDYPEVLYHAFPSKSGAPAYASVLSSGKFGIIDIRNGSSLLTAEYDKITPIGNGYAALQKADSLYLYSVSENLMITSHGYESMADSLLYCDILAVRQGGREKLYNIADHRWTLPDDHTLERLTSLPGNADMAVGLAALLKKGGKGALFEIRTGEQLTEYLFDDVEKELIGDKYTVVTVTGKKGVYDVNAKKYVLPCEYAKVEGYCEFKGDEFVIVTKAGKQGIYNISKNKLIVTALNDAVDIRDGYARIRRGVRYAVYSLEHNKMVFDSPVDKVELMNDGYAILKVAGAEMTGVYDLNRNEWHIDPENSYYDWYWSGDYMQWHNDQIINYKTKKIVFSPITAETIYYFDGDYVLSTGDYCDSPTFLYKFGGSMLVDGAIERLIKKEEAPLLGRDIAFMHSQTHDGDDDYIGNIIETYIGVYDIADQRYKLEYKYEGDAEICYDDFINQGLVIVKSKNGEKRLYDIVKEKWLFSVQGEIQMECVKRNYQDMLFSYSYITLPDGTTYLFDPYERNLVKCTAYYGLEDYLNFKKAMHVISQKLRSQYDRISLMYQQK